MGPHQTPPDAVTHKATPTTPLEVNIMGGPKHISGQATLPTPNSTNSFWHKEPSEYLLGHRTTESLPSSADIVIIGSGISGASAAYHIRQQDGGKNLKIVMLEAREACWGATGRNGGHCQPGVYYPPPDIAEFELRNYDSIKSLIAKHNIPCEWKTLNGCHNYMSKSMFDLAVTQVEALRAYSPKLAEMVKVITKESTNPSLLDLRIPRAAGAIVQQKAASLWPYKFVAWILEDLIKKETLNLQTTTPVTSLQKVDSGWIVHTSRGMLAAPKVLLCTNGYTSALIPEFSDLIVPVRGEMSALIPPASMKPTSTSNRPLELSYVFLGNDKQSINQDDYLVQRPFSTTTSGQVGGELMFGGARMYAAHAGIGVSDDSAIDEPAAAYLRRELNIVLDLQNDCKDLKASHEWSGIMGYSRDGHPWVGEVTEEMGAVSGKGLWVCAGFTGHGMPNTWLSAAAASDLMLGKEKDEVDLPKAYALSMERIAKARSYDEVWLADSKGIY